MTLYRIYTEDVNRDGILAATESHFDAFTLIPSRGAWRGHSEASLILEIVGNDSDAYLAVHALAGEIKAINRQDAVLITQTPITQTLV
jgi:hypothetical protein